MTKQLAVRSVQPDYRFTDINQWRRYITHELFHVQNKNLYNKAKDVLTQRVKFIA